MQSKTLLFNRGIIIQNIRSVGWVGIAYFLSLVFASPLQILIAYSMGEKKHHYFLSTSTTLFSISHEFQVFLIFLVPVLLSIFLFRYMQVKLSSDFIHSLPLKREQLYHQHMLFGVIILLLPIILVGIILTIIGTVLPPYDFLAVNEIMEWVAITSFFSIFVFVSGVFVAMFTGMSLLQGALIYIMFLFPAGISVLVLLNLQFYWYGFIGEFYLNNKIERVIPFVRFTDIDHLPLSILESVIYTALILFFYFCALLVYKVRNVETATQAIAFRPLQPVFKYGVTFSAMLVGGVYFGSTTNESFGWLLFGYIAASIIGYFIAVMILEKTWRVFNKWKGYGIFLALTVIFSLIVQMDVFGYEKRLPSEEEIKRAYFAESIHYLTIEQYPEQHYPHKEVSPSYFYEDKDNIKHIVALHEQIIQDQALNENIKGETRSVVFAYELASGGQQVRQYSIPSDAYEAYYKPIVQSQEYKLNHNPVLKVKESSNIQSVAIMSTHLGKRVTITDPEDIREFHDILQAEIQAESYEDIKEWDSWSQIEYFMSDDVVIRSQWRKSYSVMEEWFKENGLIDQVRITADDVKYAIVVKNEENLNTHDFIYGNNLEFSLDNREDVYKFDNAAQIEEALYKATWDNNSTYIIAFYYHKYPHPDFKTFSEEHVPDFILEKLE